MWLHVPATGVLAECQDPGHIEQLAVQGYRELYQSKPSKINGFIVE